MRRRLLALPAAIAAMVLTAGTAAAVWPPGTVTVETDGCQFTIHIDLDTQPDIIGWEVRTFADVPLDGDPVLEGSGAPDAEGRLTVGPLEAEPGHYNAIVDDEVPVDTSSNVAEFTLECSAATPTGSEQPVESGSASPSPTGEELPAVGTPPPAEGAAGVTPPPTDATAAEAASGEGGWLTAVVLGTLGALAFAMSYRQLARIRVRR